MTKIIDPETLLDVLGSKTRRKILIMLAQRPRFVSEISEELGIGRKAVLDHLSFLEKCGIVRIVERRIKKGRPRKYYEINKSLFLGVSIVPDFVDFSIAMGGKTSEFIEKIDSKLDEIEIREFEDKRVILSEIIREIEKRIREIEEEWVELQKIMARARKLLNI